VSQVVRKFFRFKNCYISFVLVPVLLIVLLLTSSAPAAGADAKQGEQKTPLQLLVESKGVKGDGVHYLGALPSSPEDAGRYERLRVPSGGAPLAASVDLSSYLPPVGDQAMQGSCTAWSTSYYYKTWLEKHEHAGWDLTDARNQSSPVYVYNQINSGGNDTGSYIQDALALIEERGVTDMESFPYTDSECATQPTLGQLNAARPYRIQPGWGYFWLNADYPANNPIEDAKAWLDGGNAFVCVIPIFDDFPDMAGNPVNKYYDYDGSSMLAGTHAVCIVGYDDDVNPGGADPDHKGGFYMVNSWGPTWNGSNNGFVYLSYDFMRRYCLDAWSAVDAVPDSPSLDSLSSASGNIGAPIELSGNNLGWLRRSASVTFNGVPATDLSYTNEAVTAYVPPGATSGPVIARDWEGTVTASIPFTVGTPVGPAPGVVSVSPDVGENRGPVSISVSGSGFAPGCQLTLAHGGESIEATGEAVNGSGRVTGNVNIRNAHLGGWDVTATNPDGQNATLPVGFTVAEASDTYEPNDTIGSSYGPLASGTYISYIHNGDPNDYYRTTELLPGGNITIELDNPAGCDNSLYLYDQSGSEVAFSEAKAGKPRISFTATSSGHYRICVTPEWNWTLMYPYALSFSIDNPAPTITSITPSSGPPGTVVTVAGNNFGADRDESTVLFNDVPAEDYPSWSNTHIEVVVPGGASTGPVVVRARGVSSNNDRVFTLPTPTWYLAEGSTAWGFSTYICIQNPASEDLNASVTYMLDDASTKEQTVGLPALSQVTVNPADTVGSADFSTKVRCVQGKTIAVDRTMSWTGEGAASPEGHASVGVTAPAKTWYLPEGSSAWGFETWLLIQNPNVATATTQVTYMIEGEGPKTVSHKVPANSRRSFKMEADIGQKNASIKVDSDIAVIPERAMYRNNKREGHDSIGTTTPANDYYMAEGTTAWGFTAWVLIQNPGSVPSDVTITYMTPSGQKAQPSFTLPGNSRKTIKVNDVAGMANTDFSSQVHGSQPIIAERSMYWDNGTGEACHDSIGIDQAHTTFYLPDGETSNGRETWTLVQNPNSISVTVDVSYLKAGGEAVTLAKSIPANSRMTFNMADKVPSGRASIMVTSKTAGKKIIVERAMYWNKKGAGTDTIGGYSD